jgi:iron complex outermembrane receptor protein
MDIFSGRRAYTRALITAPLLAALSLATQPAFAQRTDDNATQESDDAFGRSVGNESIGIYDDGEVRGFSPIDAGNVRIEGLYFDRLSDPTQRLIDGSAVRVGIAAQSYPFPSPTGIVDYALRRVGDERVISPVLTYGPYGGSGAEVDALLPLFRDRLGVAIGAGFHNDRFEWGGSNRSNTLALIPRWRPTENIEVMPFYSRVLFSDEEPRPLVLTADGLPPPRMRRDHYYGQRWAQNEGETRAYGVLGEARWGEWIARVGLFESAFLPDAEYGELFVDTDVNGFAHERVVAFPESRYASRSGELRLSRSFEGADRRHTLHLTAKGRTQDRRYGGEDVIEAGIAEVGVGRALSRPQFRFGEQSRDEIEQETAGAAYELRWKDLGEMSVGVQKTFYSKSGATPDGPLPESRSEPLLVNVTATVYASDNVAFYGSYSEGLEESPVAPDNAVNRNVAAPALSTEQYDAGVRWALSRNVKLIAGVFNIEKPYFDLDADGLFRSLGAVEHRGVELSLVGKPMENLTFLAGTRFLDAQVSGPTVDARLIGEKPVGSAKNLSVVSVDYGFRGTGVSVDAILENVSEVTANTANTVEVGGRTVLNIGGRYRFELFDKPATVRAQVQNVFDKYGWKVVSGGAYVYNPPRRFSIYLAMDL